MSYTPAQIQPTLYQGDTFAYLFTFEENGSAFDLTMLSDISFRFFNEKETIFEHTVSGGDLTISGASSNELSGTASAETMDIGKRSYYLEITFIFSDGSEITYVAGRAKVIGAKDGASTSAKEFDVSIDTANETVEVEQLTGIVALAIDAEKKAEQAYQNASKGSGLNPEYVSTVLNQKPKDYVPGSGIAFGSYPIDDGLIQNVQWNDSTSQWDNFGDPFSTPSFGNTSFTKKIESVAGLQSEPGIFEGLFNSRPTRQLLGYNDVGDGGGGEVYWDADEDKQNHNGGTIISPTWANGTFANTQDENWFSADTADTGFGCWVRSIVGKVDVRFFGAVGDDATDNTVAINAVRDFVRDDEIKSLYFPRGVYLVSDGIMFENVAGENDFNGLTVSGDGNGSVIKLKAGTYNEAGTGTNTRGLLRFRSRNDAGVTPLGDLTIRDLKVDVNASASSFGLDNIGTGLQVIDESHSGGPIRFENITVVNCHGTGILADCHTAMFESIYIDGVDKFHGIGSRSSVTMYNNIVAKNIAGYGIDFSGVHGTTDNNSVNIANNIWIENSGDGAKITPETKEIFLNNAYFINNTNGFSEAAATDCRITFNNVTFENIENGFNLNDSIVSFNNLTLINVNYSGTINQAFLMNNATGTNLQVFDHISQPEGVLRLVGDCSIKNIYFSNNEGVNIVNGFTCDAKIDSGVIDVNGITGTHNVIAFDGPDRHLMMRDITFKGDDSNLTATALTVAKFRVIDNNFDNFAGQPIDFIAPDELIMRNNKGYKNESFGIETFSGDGSSTLFIINTGLDLSTHGASDTPYWDVTPASSDANINFYVEEPSFHVNDTLRVIFDSPPPAGTDNVKLQWKAGFQVVS